MNRQRTAAWLLALLAAVPAGCEHSRPADPGDPAPPPPLTGPPPVRLTFNPASDWNPVYSRDGSGILYSFAVPGRADRDRCLGLLPEAGGTLQGELCWRGALEEDSADVVISAAESPGGRLAFVVERGSPSSFAPTARALLVGPPRDPEHAVLALPFPTTAGSSPYLWFGAGDLTWMDDSTLVFVAQMYAYQRGTATEAPDTLITGIEVARLILRGDSAVPRVYGITRFASSVAAGPAPGVVIFTRGGDSRVFTLALASGAVGVLYDFGALGIARDARLVDGKLLAVVGGFVSFGFEAVHAMYVQRDQGGPVFLVDLLGAAVPILLTPETDRVYRHPTLAPSGAAFVAEGYRVIETPVTDTTLVRTVVEVSDLYRVPVQ